MLRVIGEILRGLIDVGNGLLLVRGGGGGIGRFLGVQFRGGLVHLVGGLRHRGGGILRRLGGLLLNILSLLAQSRLLSGGGFLIGRLSRGGGLGDFVLLLFFEVLGFFLERRE